MKEIIKNPAIADLTGWLDKAAYVAILGFLAVLTIAANVDNADGRFGLSMDERITFDGVKALLHSGNTSEFFSALIDGGDQRYGRSLWNSIAIFAAIPEALFGDQGQIIAARMLQVFLLVASVGVFASLAPHSRLLRLVLIISIVTMPFASYFMTLPKPEPLQLLFLALFSFFYVKENAAFSWYWIFIGLALGTKISTLPALLVFIFVAVAVRFRRGVAGQSFESMWIAGVSICLGLGISIPQLLGPVLFGIAELLAFRWAAQKFYLATVYKVVAAAALSIVFIMYSRDVLTVWVRSTFLNTTHGADRENVNFQAWVDYVLNDWLIAPSGIALLLVTPLFAFLTVQGVLILKDRSHDTDYRTAAFAVAAAGAALNFAIMLGTKRLWGHYLYPGTVLLIVGSVILIDLNRVKAFSGGLERPEKFAFAFGCLTATLIATVSLLYWLPVTVDKFAEASSRTKDPFYKVQYESFQEYSEFLAQYDAPQAKRIRVMISPQLFPLESDEKYEVSEFWGPFNQWSYTDIIIFSVVNTPRSPLPPEDSLHYERAVQQRKSYRALVHEKGASCVKNYCFVREMILPNGGEILVRKD